MKTSVIYGPPCSGKSTLARGMMGEKSVLYDYDALIRAMTTRQTHELEKSVAHGIALACRRTLIDKLGELPEDAEAIILTHYPSDRLRRALEPYAPAYIPANVDLDECLSRLAADDSRADKAGWEAVVRGWFDEHSYSLPELPAEQEETRDMPGKWKRTCVLRGADFETREDNGELLIDGYFAVFDSQYWLWQDAYETIDRGAFALESDTDVRALVNHDTTLVLGRTTAGTLTLRVDERGLYGVIRINPQDQDAVNLYARVKRGDVNQCSFGFDILDEEREYRPDGVTVYHLKRVKLYEVSVCTFPAYEDTAVQARAAEAETERLRRLEAWKVDMLARVAGGMPSK